MNSHIPGDRVRRAAWAAGLALLLAGPAAAMDVKVTQNTQALIPYQVFELTFQHAGTYTDPTWDVVIDVTFTSPAGKTARVGGFFYGSSRPQKPIIKEGTDARGRRVSQAVWPCDSGDLWKARYAPAEIGRWTFRYTVRNTAGDHTEGQGTFEVVKGRVPQKGFVRINPENPFRLVFDDGTPFYPVGFQQGMGDPQHLGSVLTSFAMEGPFRTDGVRPATPPGAMFVRGPGMGPQNGDVYFGRHARAGFNLLRFSPNNATMIKLFAAPDGNNSRDHVRWEEARMIDEMLSMARKYGIRIFYGFFGYMNVCALDTAKEKDPSGRPIAGELEKVKRLIKYSVDRWGATVDIWQFLNEQKADTAWYEMMIPYLKSIDPYAKPICTSWERPELAGIDINSPHAYQSENELASDALVAGWARSQKRRGKPVIYGEQGNRIRQGSDLVKQGIGGVWDPGSARRMRVRLWSAFFNELAFIFWETSYARDGHYMNLWIGPEERQYVHALQDFAHRLDPGIRMAPVVLSKAHAGDVRAYGLRSQRRAAVYLHHFTCAQCRREGLAPPQHSWDHDRGEVRGLTVTLEVPRAAQGYWYSPSDARVLARFNVPAGQGTFPAPPFTVDLALLITEEGPPDIDRDGTPNDQDDDDDNDGVPDARDAFPLEREEWADVDGDRIGDSLDADVDADGQADDLNKNGSPDNAETDWDGDGVPNARAIPWDAFPRDPKEWRDTDGDGVGDNADPDDDGDGYTDAEERAAGTDPLDPVRFPAGGP